MLKTTKIDRNLSVSLFNQEWSSDEKQLKNPENDY